MRYFGVCRAVSLNHKTLQSSKRCASYQQGQNVNNQRQYFYYVDHQGMLFLDDARIKNFTSCFKEERFLKFFLSRIRLNRYENKEFWPYVSRCGDEMNFIRCDDLPVVYQTLFYEKSWKLGWGNEKGLLSVPFKPNDVAMCPQTGRVYHPAPDLHGSIGLIKSKLAIELSSSFIFDGTSHSPVALAWDGVTYDLNHSILDLLNELPALGRYNDCVL